jgi:hypothetical protein
LILLRKMGKGNILEKKLFKNLILFRHDVLILTYLNGFQIWDLKNPDNVHEILSKREGPIKYMKVSLFYSFIAQ